jgi:S-adenosylmethionine hydrolase
VSPIVTFTSDFGTTDWFVGVVHGVVHDGCADARVVDLTHEVPPGDIDAGAFVLEAAAPDFPPGTVHLAVVDPGVGTSRLALAVAARGQWFVGPDNGLLEWALCAPGARVHALSDAKWLRQPVSRTFHARDVFAPVAAHLACGVPLDRFGPAVAAPVRRPRSEPHLADDGSLTGCIVYLDRFGNALTDLTTEWLDRAFQGIDGRDLIVDVLDRTIDGIRGSYGEAKIGALVALLGSSGRLEIAEVGGNSSHRFGIGVRDQVRIRRR